MRPAKRATLIARSIAKMIEASGGASPELAAVVVRLPMAVFDQLRLDAGETADTAKLRIHGVTFERSPNKVRQA